MNRIVLNTTVATLTVLCIIPIITSCVAVGIWLFAKPYDDTKHCAHALALLHTEADCMAIPNGGCFMTLSDLERVLDAGAEKQEYCPAPKPFEQENDQ